MRLKSKPSKKQLDNPFDYLLALKEGGIKGVYDEQTLEEMGDEGAAILNINVDAEIDICEQIRKITASKVIIPRDLKIDDGDLPTAKNFYEWCTQDRFGTIGDERPFLEQLIWGVIAFNENCYNPKCTDLEWLLYDHKVDDTFSKFERKVTMLEFGVCPNCGKGRSEMFHAGKMPFYNELGINAGQRCVRGSTPVITKDGIIRIEELRPNSDYGFTEFEEYIHNGECMEKSSHFYAAEPEPVTRVTTATGFCVVGTPDHPLMTEHGFKKISDITTSDKVRVYVGTRQFGVGKCESPLLDGKFFRDTNVPRSIRTLDAENTTLWLQGLFHAPVHAFLSEIALRDVSAMLLNAGYLHSIHGPAIKLTDKQFEGLHAGRYKVGVAYDPVSQITNHSAEETFDFTLPDTHEFLTGGILSHNSGKSHTLGTYLYPYYNHRLMKLQNPAQFYGLSRTTRLQGTFAALTYTQAKDTLWTPFYGAITQTRWYCLEENSRITMANGSEKLIRDMQVGDEVKTFEGSNDVVNVFDNGEKECFNVELANHKNLTGTAEHKLRCLSPCGTQLVWKTIGELTEDDYVVCDH